MPSEPKYATMDGGERLETSRPEQTRSLSHTNFDDFEKQLERMREEADLILEQLDQPSSFFTWDQNFQSLAGNFADRNARLSECRGELRRTTDRLTKEIENEEKEQEKKGAKSFETELKKLERNKFMTFKEIVDKELRREEFFKEKAMEKYLAKCVNNELDTSTPA